MEVREAVSRGRVCTLCLLLVIYLQNTRCEGSVGFCHLSTELRLRTGYFALISATERCLLRTDFWFLITAYCALIYLP